MQNFFPTDSQPLRLSVADWISIPRVPAKTTAISLRVPDRHATEPLKTSCCKRISHRFVCEHNISGHHRHRCFDITLPLPPPRHKFVGSVAFVYQPLWIAIRLRSRCKYESRSTHWLVTRSRGKVPHRSFYGMLVTDWPMPTRVLLVSPGSLSNGGIVYRLSQVRCPVISARQDSPANRNCVGGFIRDCAARGQK